MLQSQQIKELRQTGKLEESLALALQDLEQNPDNLYAKRNISWVYYELLKKSADTSDFNSFIDTCSKILDLQLPENEEMFFNNLIWPINKFLRSLSNIPQQRDFNKINKLYTIAQQFPFSKNHDNYSVLFGALHKAYKDSREYCAVIDWLGLENLKENDFQPEEYNGRKIMSLAEQTYIAYAKNLEQGEPLDACGQNRKVDINKINEFLPLLNHLIENHPEYTYPSYFKAKLLLKLEGDGILSAFLPFAKNKRNEYWVWQLMAEIYKDDQEIVFQCYCKALSLRSPDEFLVKIREIFASILIQRRMFSEAKTEIENILKVKEQTETKIPPKVVSWTNEEWYKTAKSKTNNIDLYRTYNQLAEELMFSDIEEKIAVVTFVNTEKNIINFIIDRNQTGFFKYNQSIRIPKMGDVLKIKFKEYQNDGFCQVYNVKKGADVESKAIKYLEGEIKIIPSGIGFLDDIFVDKSLVDRHKIQNGQMTKVKAILTFNKKKSDWGWKAIEIF